MKVKICGIQDVKTAIAAVEYGADALGFVFAESKRKIEIDIAKAIIAALPKSVMKVGVFVNETKENIERIASFTGLTHLQLHGEETPEFCRTLRFPIIKAISISSKEDMKKIELFSCEYYLLDGPKGRYQGGNGQSFNWKLLHQEILQGKKWILAGGLNNENLKEAVNKIRPYMVDVSSGVETGGKKDFIKINSFIKKAKEIK